MNTSLRSVYVFYPPLNLLVGTYACMGLSAPMGMHNNLSQFLLQDNIVGLASINHHCTLSLQVKVAQNFVMHDLAIHDGPHVPEGGHKRLTSLNLAATSNSRLHLWESRFPRRMATSLAIELSSISPFLYPYFTPDNYFPIYTPSPILHISYRQCGTLRAC